jgi:glycerol-3-phosphate acyltransferase PlsY
VNHPPRPILLGAAGAAALIIAKHHANIRRLLAGTEGKVGKKAAGRSQ